MSMFRRGAVRVARIGLEGALEPRFRDSDTASIRLLGRF